MADIERIRDGVNKKVKDMGDGTYADVVYAETAGASSAVPSAIGHGRKVVAAAGTAEALASTTSSKSVVITALNSNTGTVCVGGATVVAAAGTRTGAPLAAGESVSLDIDDLSKVFLDVTAPGEGVSYTYVN